MKNQLDDFDTLSLCFFGFPSRLFYRDLTIPAHLSGPN